MDSNFGPRQEGSQAIFTCNAGYNFFNASNGNRTCAGGRWTGEIPRCVRQSSRQSTDIDQCAGIKCGGPSKCKNGIEKYTCECAEGWSGGGVNKTCERGYCECTGNKGDYQAEDQLIEGHVKEGYEYEASYGNKCGKHHQKKLHPRNPEPWRLEPWCVNRLFVRPTLYN